MTGKYIPRSRIEQEIKKIEEKIYKECEKIRDYEEQGKNEEIIAINQKIKEYNIQSCVLQKILDKDLREE